MSHSSPSLKYNKLPLLVNIYIQFCSAEILTVNISLPKNIPIFPRQIFITYIFLKSYAFGGMNFRIIFILVSATFS